MPRLLRFLPVLAAGLFFPASASAHFHMLLLSSPSAKKGEPVTLNCQWGHPFEHQLFDMPAPQSLVVLAPDGKKSDLTKTLDKVALPGADGKKVTAYRASFTPADRGDYVFVLTAGPVWMEEEKEFYQDTVKAVLHVQAQKGWDASAGSAFELAPLTRPYGLLPGSVFQAQALFDGKAMGGAPVEIERYNATAPKELPPDEFVTRTARTAPDGVLTTTLPEPGWWCLTVSRDGGTREREGKKYPVRQRTTFWVHVADKAK